MTDNYISRTAKCTNCGHEGTLFFTEAEAVEVEKRNIQLQAELDQARAHGDDVFFQMEYTLNKKIEALESQAARLSDELSKVKEELNVCRKHGAGR